MKKQLINEAERLQQLAGIKEMKINIPGTPRAADDIPEEVDELLDALINMSIPEDADEGDTVEGVWDANEYADENEYGSSADDFIAAHKYMLSKGGKILVPGEPDVIYSALPNGDIGYSFVVEF